MRDLIISEIRRIAAASGGKPPGKSAFARQTGIAEGKWGGVYWSKWSDALAEAGFEPNQWTRRLDTTDLVKRIAAVTLELGHVPTTREMKLIRRNDPKAPSPGITREHFQDQNGIIEALRNLGSSDKQYASLLALLPTPKLKLQPGPVAAADGYVYLIKWENRYKIGRSDDPGRALKEIRAQLPTSASIIHTIQTDDPSGIEAYWHRRFGEQRLRGEWFDLTLADIKAFQRRKFQ